MDRDSGEKEASEALRLTPRRKAAFAAATLVLALVFAAIAAELLLRAAGRSPRSVPGGGADWVMEPDEGFFRYSERRGYAYGPGTFRVTLPSGHVFEIHHDAEGWRRTAPADADTATDSRPEIWILGGSFTHGWSVDDDETFPWMLQELLPEVRVRNLGVGGYGTLLSWIQLEEALETHPAPAGVVLAYASFHDERNVWTRSWRRAIAPARPEEGRPVPRALPRADGGFDVIREVPRYRAFPMERRSALVDLLEDKAGRIENRLRLHSHAVTASILDTMARRCKEVGSDFVVAGILANDATRARLASCAQAGMDTVDVAVDLDRGLRNLPHDRHPGPRAHRIYAERLAARLRALSLEDSSALRSRRAGAREIPAH